jgi:hypothetical protein
VSRLFVCGVAVHGEMVLVNKKLTFLGLGWFGGCYALVFVGSCS